MFRFFLVALGSGLLFGVMDALINANPLAQRLYEVYKPMNRKQVKAVSGTLIDLGYGLLLATLFLMFYDGLTGETGIMKGISFAVVLWFLRVVMGVATEYVTREIPPLTLCYTLFAGLLEMLVLGILYGLTLHPGIWL